MELGDERRPDGAGGLGVRVRAILGMAGLAIPGPTTAHEAILPDSETARMDALEGHGPVEEASANIPAEVIAEATEAPVALRGISRAATRIMFDLKASRKVKSEAGEMLALAEQLNEQREAAVQEAIHAKQETVRARQEAAELALQLGARDLEAAHMTERIFHLQRDSLTKALRLDGFIDLLRNTEEGTEILVDIEAGRVGVKHVDGRGVKSINDERGYPAGSRYLAKDARNLDEEVIGLRRSGSRRSRKPTTWPDGEDRRESTDRRRSHTVRDVIIRLGGDEFIILEIGAKLEDTVTTATKMKALLSPDAAIARVKRGGIPFTSSVSWAHLTQVVDTDGLVTGEHRRAVEEQYEVYADAPEVIIKLLAGINLASQKQDIEKAEQYDQMLKLIEETLAARNEEMPAIQTDPRLIAIKFFEVCCDDWLNKWPR